MVVVVVVWGGGGGGSQLPPVAVVVLVVDDWIGVDWIGLDATTRRANPPPPVCPQASAGCPLQHRFNPSLQQCGPIQAGPSPCYSCVSLPMSGWASQRSSPHSEQLPPAVTPPSVLLCPPISGWVITGKDGTVVPLWMDYSSGIVCFPQELHPNVSAARGWLPAFSTGDTRAQDACLLGTGI